MSDVYLILCCMCFNKSMALFLLHGFALEIYEIFRRIILEISKMWNLWNKMIETKTFLVHVEFFCPKFDPILLIPSCQKYAIFLVFIDVKISGCCPICS